MLADPGYSHKYYVDLTPFAKTVNGVDLLVGGLGKGGKGYYCLDVTDPFTIATEAALAARVKWEFPKATTDSDDVADIGYSFSRPVIVNTKAGWVIIFGNGYNSPNESALLFALAIDGSVLAKIDTDSGPSNGLSTPAVVDVNNDLLADYVYAGDLLGNLWKFDIRSASPGDWKVAHTSGGAPAPLFAARGPGDSIQPITTKPDVMFHCARHGYIVVFGTGKYLGSSDFDDFSTQALYGIWDYGDDTDSSEFLGPSTERLPPISPTNLIPSLCWNRLNWCGPRLAVGSCGSHPIINQFGPLKRRLLRTGSYPILPAWSSTMRDGTLIYPF